MARSRAGPRRCVDGFAVTSCRQRAYAAKEGTTLRLVRRSAGKIAAVLLTATPLQLGGGRERRRRHRLHPVCQRQRIRLRPPDGRARSERSDSGNDHARDPPPPRSGGRREERRDRARRGARAGRLPFAEQSLSLLGPIVSTRDLIVFDTRGTGFSHPLSCRSLESSNANNPPGEAISKCAQQIGPTRRFYTTADSVADIEAIRVAGGYEKLVLYGTSYGTKLAEEYAQVYPSHVEALVLDSVVPPNGPDPLNRATFAAVPRILRQLCAQRAAAHITPTHGRPRQPHWAPWQSLAARALDRRPRPPPRDRDLLLRPA